MTDQPGTENSHIYIYVQIVIMKGFKLITPNDGTLHASKPIETIITSL